MRVGRPRKLRDGVIVPIYIERDDLRKLKELKDKYGYKSVSDLVRRIIQSFLSDKFPLEKREQVLAMGGLTAKQLLNEKLYELELKTLIKEIESNLKTRDRFSREDFRWYEWNAKAKKKIEKAIRIINKMRKTPEEITRKLFEFMDKVK